LYLATLVASRKTWSMAGIRPTKGIVQLTDTKPEPPAGDPCGKASR